MEGEQRSKTVKKLCMEAATAITERIKKHCHEDDACAVKQLCECLSILDNIIYASKEDRGGEAE
jgi:hypothetical protein